MAFLIFMLLCKQHHYLFPKLFHYFKQKLGNHQAITPYCCPHFKNVSNVLKEKDIMTKLGSSWEDQVGLIFKKKKERSINVIYHMKREKSQMMISVDEENTFEKLNFI